MKYLLIFFIILILALGFGLLMHQDPGYVLLVYDKWSIETTLWVLLLAILLLFIVLYSILTLWRGFKTLRKNLSRWLQTRQERRAQKLINLGLQYFTGNHWPKMLSLLPQLERHKILNQDKLVTIKKQLYLELMLCKVEEDIPASAINKFWHKIPVAFRLHAPILLCYFEALIKKQEKLVVIEKILAKELKHNANNAALLLCLGKICRLQKLWGKSQNYLQSSLTLREDSLVYQEFALLMEDLGNKEKALEYYRSSGMQTIFLPSNYFKD
jgi:uncharacterized protein HemY